MAEGGRDTGKKMPGRKVGNLATRAGRALPHAKEGERSHREKGEEEKGLFGQHSFFYF